MRGASCPLCKRSGSRKPRDASGLNLAFEPAARPSQRVGVRTRHTFNRMAAPIDRAPLAIAPGPGDAAQARHEKNGIVISRFDHHLSGSIDQPPFAVPEKSHEAVLEVDADPFGVDIDPTLAGRR